MLGEPTPAEADPGGSFYTFQKGVIKGGAPGEQETLFGPMPANPVKLGIRRKCRSASAGAGAWSETEEECLAIERYQWMRCKEGGQVFGNRQEIRPLAAR
jgi:hypothetical protein